MSIVPLFQLLDSISVKKIEKNMDCRNWKKRSKKVVSNSKTRFGVRRSRNPKNLIFELEHFLGVKSPYESTGTSLKIIWALFEKLHPFYWRSFFFYKRNLFVFEKAPCKEWLVSRIVILDPEMEAQLDGIIKRNWPLAFLSNFTRKSFGTARRFWCNKNVPSPR